MVALLFIFSAVACQNGNGGQDGATTLQRIQETGVVKVGYANEAPYAYQTDDGRLTGEAPEIARKVLADLGVKEVQGVLTEFGSLIPGLKAGRFDVIAAGMYILPERCKQIAFTNPTYKIGEAFLVSQGNPHDLHSYQDARENEEVTVGVVAGAVELGYARAIGIPNDRISVLPDPPSAVSALESGRIDAYGGTSLTVNDMMQKSSSGKVAIADPFENPVINGEEKVGYGAFGIRKDDTDLLKAFNDRLAEFIGSKEHRTLVQPFGFTERELPGNVTAQQLCNK